MAGLVADLLTADYCVFGGIQRRRLVTMLALREASE
jgi:hypothetical protein